MAGSGFQAPWLLGAALLAALLIGGAAALAVVLRANETRFIYFPSGAVQQTPADAGLAFEDVALRTADGETLRAWYLPAGPLDARGPVLLFFHGNAGSREHRLHNLLGLHRLGVPVLIFDYRGYGGSSGAPGEAGLYRDGEAAFDWLRARVGTRPIVCFGRSLGGAVAAHTALQRPAAGLILESAFTSAPELAAAVFPLPGVRYVMRTQLDTRAALLALELPLLVIHGDADEVVPYAMGVRLVAAARTPRKTFHSVPGGHHNDTYVVAGEDYWRWLDAFLQAL